MEDKNKFPVKKVLFICSKATLESVYACFVMANGARMEGIDSEIFFTFFGLEAIQKKRLDHLHVATVGNPGMHMPTLLGGLPGMESLATNMMKTKIEKLDIPPIGEFIEIMSASGVKLWACKLAIEMFDLKKEDLIDELDGILTIGDFYERAAGEGTQIIFI
jgi:peroxiredoxin family protein